MRERCIGLCTAGLPTAVTLYQAAGIDKRTTPGSRYAPLDSTKPTRPLSRRTCGAADRYCSYRKCSYDSERGPMELAKPVAVFDRDREWNDLATFAAAPGGGVRLGLLYGRRRQGKSFLLRALTEATDGFYHLALEEGRRPALQRFGRQVAGRLGVGGEIAFGDWEEALRAVLRLRISGGPLLLVIDELPYVLQHSPEVPSILQMLYDEARSTEGPAVRIILCGSAMSIMSRLLSGTKALRGRARLDLPLGPFDFRQARAHWQIADLEVAFTVHALLGGTPGYRDLVEDDPPQAPQDLDGWLARSLLNPSHALFREADYLLSEEPTITDRGLYHSAIGAISRGRSTPGKVASALGRDEGGTRHVLSMLERARLIERDADVLRERRPFLRVADPILRFDQLVIRPHLAALERRDARRVWTASAGTVAAQIAGPHFERLAREWTARFASPETLGGTPTAVGRTVVNDASARAQAEIDVVAVDAADAGRMRALLIGEGKGGTAPRTSADLQRLSRVRELLAGSDRVDVREARLGLFSRGGFAPELRRAAKARDDVVLVDLERLYDGE